MTTAPDRINLWHGYALADIHQLAITAAARAHGNILDPGDRYNTAWSAIAETLWRAEKPPTTTTLIKTGIRAVIDTAQDHRRHAGIPRTWDGEHGDTTNFRRYWELHRHATQSPEDPVIDRQALRQIWPRLQPRDQQVLYALAIHDGNHRAAAVSLGYGLRTYRNHLSDARAAYRALWHQHETPSPMWGRSGTRGTATAARTLTARLRARERRNAAAVDLHLPEPDQHAA